MNTKYLVIVATITAMLVAATALATDSAFADKKKDIRRPKQHRRRIIVVMALNPRSRSV
jgi:hypothetical protein